MATILPRYAWLSLTALMLVGAGERARGQEEGGPTRSDINTIEGRERGLLHRGGDALEIIGIDESGHDYRARTPALARVERHPVAVDADENYRRRLQSYTQAGLFSAPLPAAPTEPLGTPETSPAAAQDAGADAPHGWRHWPWLALSLGALVLLLASRRRQAASD